VLRSWLFRRFARVDACQAVQFLADAHELAGL
jgi:hypothetical protein